MPADHREIAFEAAIAESLLTHGFLKGDPEAFDRELAPDRGELLALLRCAHTPFGRQGFTLYAPVPA